MIVYVIRIFDIYVSDPSVGNIVYIHVVSQLYRLACCFNMPVSVFSLDFQNNSKFLVKSMCFIRRKYMNVKFVQKIFSQKTNLYRHNRSQHKKLIRKFKCNECGRLCVTKHSVKTHWQRAHHGQPQHTIVWLGEL